MIAFLWNEGKRRGGGGKVGEPSHLQLGRLFQHRHSSPRDLSPQGSTQNRSLAQLLPLLIAQRQLAETALNRAAAPCSHLSGQHHPWLMQSSWKSFIVQQLLTGLSWETQPGASLGSAHKHSGAGVGLAAVPFVCRTAQGWCEQPALKHHAKGCEAQGRAEGKGRSTRDEVHKVHSGQGLTAVATTTISYASPWGVT